MQKVVIRVDASLEMGMGHLMRCLALAGALAHDGAKVSFLLRSHAANLARLIEGEGHAVRLLPDPGHRSEEAVATGTAHAHWLPTTWQEDAEQTLEAIESIGQIGWLIVDHYALDARWEQMQRKRAPRILAIDDLADRPHDCDILLDQNLVLEMDSRYRGLLPATCKPLLGPRYALLRPEFAKQRKLLAERSGEIDRILVCYGGSDPGNETAKALAAIKTLSAGSLAVDVAIGLTNPHADAVSTLCRELPRTELFRGANNMAELMARADLAIGAGGSMCWERCSLGLPTIAVHIADNQIGALTALARAGAVAYLGSGPSVTADQIEGSVKLMVENPAQTRLMGETAQALVDGEGSERVHTAMRLTMGPQAPMLQ